MNKSILYTLAFILACVPVVAQEAPQQPQRFIPFTMDEPALRGLDKAIGGVEASRDVHLRIANAINEWLGPLQFEAKKAELAKQAAEQRAKKEAKEKATEE